MDSPTQSHLKTNLELTWRKNIYAEPDLEPDLNSVNNSMTSPTESFSLDLFSVFVLRVFLVYQVVAVLFLQVDVRAKFAPTA